MISIFSAGMRQLDQVWLRGIFLGDNFELRSGQLVIGRFSPPSLSTPPTIASATLRAVLPAAIHFFVTLP